MAGRPVVSIAAVVALVYEWPGFPWGRFDLDFDLGAVPVAADTGVCGCVAVGSRVVAGLAGMVSLECSWDYLLTHTCVFDMNDAKSIVLRFLRLWG